MSENVGTTVVVSTRVPVDDATMLFALARLEGTTASRLLRELVRQMIHPRLAAHVARRQGGEG